MIETLVLDSQTGNVCIFVPLVVHCTLFLSSYTVHFHHQKKQLRMICRRVLMAAALALALVLPRIESSGQSTLLYGFHDPALSPAISSLSPPVGSFPNATFVAWSRPVSATAGPVLAPAFYISLFSPPAMTVGDASVVGIAPLCIAFTRV